MSKAISLLVVAWTIALTCSQLCRSYSDPRDLMQAGQIYVGKAFDAIGSTSFRRSREHTYSIALNFGTDRSVFQGAGSLSGFDNIGSREGGIDFMVYIVLNKVNNLFADIILLIDEDGTWNSLKVSYFFHSRSDLYIGSWMISNYVKDKQNSSPIHTYTYTFPDNLKNQDNLYTIAGIISGFKISDTILEMRSLTNTSMNSTSFTFGVLLNSTASFEHIYYSFIFVFRNQSLPVGFYAFDSHLLTYQFFSIEFITSNELKYNNVGFDFQRVNCVGGGCPSTCVTQLECQQNKGLLANQTCFICGKDQTYNLYYCKNNVVCGQNQIYNGTACVCGNYYINVLGRCQPSCGSNAFMAKNGSCICVPGASMVCTKIRTCAKWEVLAARTCQCAQGYVLADAVCSLAYICPPQFIWNPVSNTCDPCGIGSVCCNNPDCPVAGVWDGTNCTCTEGLFYSFGQYFPCPMKSKWSDGTCVCTTINEYFKDGKCIYCPPSRRLDSKSCL